MVTKPNFNFKGVGSSLEVYDDRGDLQGRTQNLYLIKTIIISMALYEIAQPLLGKPIDPWDIVATVMTGVFCLILYKFLHPTSMDKEPLTDK